MSKNTVVTSENEVSEQEQRAVAVSAGGAATQHTWRNIGLIVKREYKNRVTQRSFIISTIVLLILVVIGAFVPTIIQYFSSTSNAQTKIAVVNKAGPIAGLDGDALARTISATLNGTANQTAGTNTSKKPPFAITIQPSNALGSLQNQVKNGSLNILLVLDRPANQELQFTYYSSNASGIGDTTLTQVQALAQQLNFLDTAHRLGLSAAQTSSLFA